MVDDINRKSQDAADSGLIDKEKYVIPPHLHDLQEADLPETQRGLVISEIAQFRERAAKREREKLRDVQANASLPSGPKMREWGKPQAAPSSGAPNQQGFGQGPQGYNKPVGFVKAGDDPSGDRKYNDDRSKAGKAVTKSDEELEQDRKEARRRDEESSFRDVCLSFGLTSDYTLTVSIARASV